MDRALIDRMFLCIGPEKAQDLRDNLVNVANPTFLQASQRAIDLWGHTTPSSHAANVETLKASWHPTEGIARLWRMIKDAVTYAVAAGHPIPPNQIEDAALICINRSQAYKQAYLSYRQLPLRNYNILQTHFNQAERDRLEVEDEAAAHGYGGNAIETADREMQQGLTEVAAALTNLGNQQQPNGDTSTLATLEKLQ